MSKVLFAPHNDDETLFAAYTIMRNKPLVVICFDSYIQNWTNWKERRKESKKAMDMLGVKVEFLGLNDKTATKEDLRKAMSQYRAKEVWASSGSHKHHKWVGGVARELFPDCMLYSTYENSDLHVQTDFVLAPSIKELDLKELALTCYKSQLEKNKVHFDAVLGGCEYYV